MHAWVQQVEPLGRRPALDGLRAVAIALVVWLHSMATLVPPSGWHLFGGGLGVDIFFVLSGFLITTLLLERADEGPGRLRRFYARRAARLLPALLAFLVVHAAVAVIVDWSLRAELVTLVGALTFTSNWVPAFGGEVAIASLPLWSLAVEEQFYLLWPAALVLLSRFQPRRARWLVLAAIGFVAAWRTVLTLAYGAGYPIVYQRTDARLDSILIGAGLAMLLRAGWSPSPRVANAAGLAGAAMVSFWVVNPIPVTDALFFGGYTLVALGTAGVILALVRGGDTLPQRLLSWRPLVALGRISYSLYLWHYLVFVLVRDLMPGGTLGRVAVAYAAALLCAVASYRGIEQPVLRWAASSQHTRAPVPRAPRSTPRPFRRAAIAATATGALLLGSGVGLASAARQATSDAADETAEAGAVPVPADGGRAPGELGGTGTDPGADPPSPGAPATREAPAEQPAPPTTAAPERIEVELVASRLVVSAPALADPLAGEASVTLSARLSTAGGEPLAGRAVHLELLDAAGCEATTDAHGVASCSVVPPAVPGDDLTVVATFAGDAAAGPASGRWPVVDA